MNKKMLPEERLKCIYHLLQSKGTVYVSELSEDLGISLSTARTDLSELESRGLARRTHGGAVLLDTDKIARERDWLIDNISVNQRMQQNVAEKEAIGKLAATLIDDGDSLMIDGGSTTQYVANNLADKRALTIITNSVFLMPTLMANNPDAALYITGGIVYRENAVAVGDLANEFISHFSVQKTILGIDGLSLENGLTVADSQEPAVSSVKRKMIEACKELIIVCDHSKIGRVCLASVGMLERIRYLVTGEDADANIIRELRDRGVSVLLVPSELY